MDRDTNSKDGKEAATALAKEIVKSGILRGIPRGMQHLRATPGRGGRVFADNGIVLAKGTKEERIQVIGGGDHKNMLRAQMLSLV